ncbi:MAG: L,D-transpeptidase family protein, partial [Flavobacteriales bacterium]|nr:L,D-transpeptidase family protein [Flavobacteriales bacterium]
TPVEYTTRHLDSAAVFALINAHPDTKADSAAIVAFYQRRAYQYAWFVNDSLSMAARNFFDFAAPSDSAIAIDSALSDRQQLMALAFSGDSLSWTDSLRAATELELTAQFFRLAEKRYSGFVQRDLRELDWYIPRRKKNVDQLLDSLVAGTMDLSPLEPLHPQYALLKERLKQLHAWEDSGDTAAIRMDPKQLRMGDSTEAIAKVRTRLFRFGDIAQDDGSALFDSTLAIAVQRARMRFGLVADPVIDKPLLSALNQPAGERIRQVLVNMERLRWVNADPPEDFILVNIPEYRMHVYEAGRIAWSMDVVVGATATRTVVFGGDLSMVVMAPYWNIPQSIIRGEILPAVKKNSGYLDRKRMEVVRGGEVVPARSIDWSKYNTGVPFVIRQKP